MQAVERGILRLDDPVAELVPQLSNLEIIDGMEDGKVRLKKNQLSHRLGRGSGLR
jgi:CubicO group peptidase (beta-lactamase class C family)